MVEELWNSWPFTNSRRTGDGGPLLRPAMDVVENDKEVTLRIDLPGMKPEDVNVSIDDHILTISGQMGDTIEREGDRYHYRERRTGSFGAAFACRARWTPSMSRRPLRRRVLTVTLPKLEQAQPKRITVKASKK